MQSPYTNNPDCPYSMIKLGENNFSSLGKFWKISEFCLAIFYTIWIIKKLLSADEIVKTEHLYGKSVLYPVVFNNRVLKYGFLGYVVGFLQNKQGTNVVDGN